VPRAPYPAALRFANCRAGAAHLSRWLARRSLCVRENAGLARYAAARLRTRAWCPIVEPEILIWNGDSTNISTTCRPCRNGTAHGFEGPRRSTECFLGGQTARSTPSMTSAADCTGRPNHPKQVPNSACAPQAQRGPTAVAGDPVSSRADWRWRSQCVPLRHQCGPLLRPWHLVSPTAVPASAIHASASWKGHDWRRSQAALLPAPKGQRRRCTAALCARARNPTR